MSRPILVRLSLLSRTARSGIPADWESRSAGSPSGVLCSFGWSGSTSRYHPCSRRPHARIWPYPRGVFGHPHPSIRGVLDDSGFNVILRGCASLLQPRRPFWTSEKNDFGEEVGVVDGGRCLGVTSVQDIDIGWMSWVRLWGETYETVSLWSRTVLTEVK